MLHVVSLSSGIVEGFGESVFLRSSVVVRVVAFSDLGKDSLSSAKRATHDRMTVVRESILSEEARWTIVLPIGDAFQCLSSERCEFSASEESGFACFGIQGQAHF